MCEARMCNIMAASKLPTGKYTPCCNELASTFPGTGMTCTQAVTGEANSPRCTGNKKKHVKKFRGKRESQREL